MFAFKRHWCWVSLRLTYRSYYQLQLEQELKGRSQMQLKEKYVTDDQGNRIGVLLDIKQYQTLLEELEELDAIRAYDNAISSDEQEISFESAIADIENSRQ